MFVLCSYFPDSKETKGEITAKKSEILTMDSDPAIMETNKSGDKKTSDAIFKGYQTKILGS